MPKQRLIPSLLWFPCVVLLFAGSALLPADVPPDFSGTYSLQKASLNGDTVKNKNATLTIVQGQDRLEITRTAASKQSVCRFSLPDGQGTYLSDGGIQGPGKAQFKGKGLFIEATLGKSRIQEHWELSADGKKLTMHRDFNTIPPGPIPMSMNEVYSRQ